MPDDACEESPSSGGLMDRRAALVSLAAVLGVAGCSGELTSARHSSAATARTPAGQAPAHQSTTKATSRRIPEPAIAYISGPDIVHGPRDRSEVALTFHGAGDRSLAEQILRVSAHRDAHVTIFAVGKWLAATPSLGPQILAAGHELGNHTWSHQQMPGLSPHAADIEVARCAEALRKATGSAGWWFRPSGTPHSTATIRAAASRSGYHRCVSYDVDSRDYLDPGAVEVAARTLAQVRPGSIVSLHLGHAGTVAALPQILAGLAAKKLQPVTLSRLLRD